MDIDKGNFEELGCGMIIGGDLLQALKNTIDFEHQVIKWEGTSVPMNKTKLAKGWKKDLQAIFQLVTEPKIVQDAAARVSCILDFKYDKANLVEIEKTNCLHLSVEKQGAILNLLRQYEDMFDGILGDFYTKLVHLNLKKDVVPKHITNLSLPTFIISKKNGTVRFISDFRSVNKCLICKPYPILK